MSELSDILTETRAGTGHILLNRPKALNALTLDKIRVMDPALRAWAADPTIRLVTVAGAGEKAFCAGGDIRALCDAATANDAAALDAFFSEEYRLNRLIKTYPKPYIAFLDGITMGGGVGISVHGPFRVATEHTLFAMPETGIGMFPDVGGTDFLPRLADGLGIYLALTGARLKAADAVAAGVCTHYIPSDRIAAVETALADPSVTDGAAVDAVLRRFADDPGPAPLEAHRDVIKRCFDGAGTVQGVLEALAADGSDWALKTRDIILSKSPMLSVVTLKQMQLGATLAFDDCMRLEYRLASRVTRLPDFAEGVRAALIDKDNAPRWTPDTLAAVDMAAVEALFGPREDAELSFE